MNRFAIEGIDLPSNSSVAIEIIGCNLANGLPSNESAATERKD
jgi:hypothetical protein